MSYSASEMVNEMGLRAYGSSFAKALSPVVAGPGKGGWTSELTIHEPFTGAWQRNMEERHGTILTYPTVYACISRISQDIGKLPFLLKREDSNGIWNIEQNNTAYWPVLRKQNAYQTAQQFREYWQISRLVQGNTYVLKGRDERGVVNRLWILDPCLVQPMISESGDIFYQLNYSIGENLLPDKYPGTQLIVPQSEIIHDRINCFHHQLIGVPPLCAANWAAVKNLKILRDSTRFFTNGASPGGILTAPAGMSDEDSVRVSEFWNTSFKGTGAGKVAVIGADMQFTPLTFKSADNQLVEQMRYSDEQICQPFGIPPFKVGIGTVPAGSKVDELNQLYYADALQAPIEAMEALIDEGLGISRPLGVELDLEPLLRMDVGKQAEVETKLVGGRVKTPNEGRRPFGLAPLEGGDTVYMQQQDFPLAEAAKNTIQKAEPVQEPEPPAEPEESPEDEELRSLRDELFMIRAIQAAREEVLGNE